MFLFYTTILCGLQKVMNLPFFLRISLPRCFWVFVVLLVIVGFLFVWFLVFGSIGVGTQGVTFARQAPLPLEPLCQLLAQSFDRNE
jgi:hypothetical protein